MAPDIWLTRILLFINLILKKIIPGNSNTAQYDKVIYTLIFLYHLQVNLNESLNGVSQLAVTKGPKQQQQQQQQ